MGESDLPTKLNFGCGTTYKEGWWNVDGGDHLERIDQQFDFEEFPYPLPDNHFEKIVLSQVFEHISWREQEACLYELYRVTAPGGSLRIEVPDMKVIAQEILGGIADSVNALDYCGTTHTNRHTRVLQELLGGQCHPFDIHKGSIWNTRLTHLLQTAGWDVISCGPVSPDKWRTLGATAMKPPANR